MTSWWFHVIFHLVTGMMIKLQDRLVVECCSLFSLWKKGLLLFFLKSPLSCLVLSCLVLSCLVLSGCCWWCWCWCWCCCCCCCCNHGLLMNMISDRTGFRLETGTPRPWNTDSDAFHSWMWCRCGLGMALATAAWVWHRCPSCHWLIGIGWCPPHSIDWFNAEITGKSDISWENRWFPVIFPLNQPIDTQYKFWWFGTWTLFSHSYIGNNQPNWFILFRGVDTTNQNWFIYKPL